MCTRHKTWPQTQRLLPPSLTHHASCCLWVGFIFMPFCLSWQTGGSGVHRQHHFDHASSHQHHYTICITLIIASSYLHHCDHASSLQHHCGHCIISFTVITLSSASLFTGSVAMCAGGWRPWWRMMVGCDVVTLVIVTVIRQSIGDGGHGKQWVAGLGISWPMPTQDQLQNL